MASDFVAVGTAKAGSVYLMHSPGLKAGVNESRLEHIAIFILSNNPGLQAGENEQLIKWALALPVSNTVRISK